MHYARLTGLLYQESGETGSSEVVTVASDTLSPALLPTFSMAQLLTGSLPCQSYL